LTQYYSKVFFEDMDTLELLPADVFPKASEHVPEIIDIIKKMMKNGYAYREKMALFIMIYQNSRILENSHI